MKILILTWRDLKHSWAGGGEIYIFELAKRWLKMGHEVTVFCGQDLEKELPKSEIVDGIKIFRKGGRYSLYLWAIWYYLTKLRKDAEIVVDVENGIPFFTPLFCRKPKVCFVYHVHGRQFFYELDFPISQIGYFLEKYIFPLVYKGLPIVAISETTKEELARIGFNKKNITVVYAGTNGPEERQGGPIEKYFRPSILYLGRIKKYKRIDLLVRIFSQILKTVPKARLLIAGWGSEAFSVVDASMKTTLRRKIRIFGPVSESEKKRLLSRSWVFVNPSIGEGWSMAVMEANLHGTPAVAFNVTGLSESIRNGETGLLADDEKDFVKKICRLLKNASMREGFSQNARRWAQKFTWDKAAYQTIRLLKKLNRK